MIILLIVHFVQVEYVASQSSLIFAALSQLLVMVCFNFSFIMWFLRAFFFFPVVSKISIGGFPWKPVLPQTQSQLLRRSSFQSSIKFEVSCSLQYHFTMFCYDHAQETSNFKDHCAIFLCNSSIVVVSYLLTSLTLGGSDLGN